MHARDAHLALLLFVVPWMTACDPPIQMLGGAYDGSAWADAELPDTSVPDGFILTQIGSDGSVTAIDPSVMCVETDASDALDASDASLPSDASFSFDAPPPGTAVCTKPLGPGDLIFDEAMLATVPGSSDRGQWLEVRSTRTCSVNLSGLEASAPHGETFRTLDVTSDVWLAPGAFFLIADTLDPTENNELPGLVLAWTGSPADALHKTSDTVTLSMGTVTIDTLIYPDKKRMNGVSMAFPSGCAPGLRADFANWVPSTASWMPGLYGTPGAPNTDVMCAVPPIPMCTNARRPTGGRPH